MGRYADCTVPQLGRAWGLVQPLLCPLHPEWCQEPFGPFLGSRTIAWCLEGESCCPALSTRGRMWVRALGLFLMKGAEQGRGLRAGA